MATYYVYKKEDETIFVSKSENWAKNSPIIKLAKVQGDRVSDKTPHCKTPLDVGGVGATTSGTTIRISTVELIEQVNSIDIKNLLLGMGIDIDKPEVLEMVKKDIIGIVEKYPETKRDEIIKQIENHGG